jgi:hypothetical protein
VDVLEINPGMYDSGILKFAISAIIIAAPIFFFLTWQIQKSLSGGSLEKDSGIRKWLTYFILLISSVVMIGWLIATINSFLNGELSTKFLLKSLASILIAGSVFGFYFYDIKRQEVLNKRDNIIRIFFFSSLFVVIAFFIASLFIVESPTQTRNRKFDDAILLNFDQVSEAINQYYADKRQLPASLDVLKADYSFITDDDLKNKATGVRYDYRIMESNKYELCATFITSNNDVKDANLYYNYNKDRWPHDAGYQCLSQKVLVPDTVKSVMPDPVMP